MPSFRAREQGSGESAYRQLRHGPTGERRREGLHAGVADLVATDGAMAHLKLLYLKNNPVSEQTEQTMQIATANRNGLEVLF